MYVAPSMIHDKFQAISTETADVIEVDEFWFNYISHMHNAQVYIFHVT